MSDIPPLPDGFQLDSAPQGGGIPAPPGFQLDHPDEQPPGFLEQFGRQLGLTGRYVLEGAGSAAGVLSDPIQALMYEASPKTQTMTGLIKGEAPKAALPYMPLGEQASWLADKLGLPKPQGETEKAVAAGSRAITGTGLTAGLGSAAGAAELAAQPMTQAVSSILGGIGQEKGGVLGGLAGSLVGGIPAGLTGLSKLALRGGEAGQQRMADNLAAFAAAGTTPTVGQATEGGLARGLESVLAKIPGGSGIMARKAEQQAGEIGRKASSIADAMAPGTDPTEAGMAIEKGITGQGGFLDRFKQQSSALYDAVDQHLPNGVEGTTVGVPATVSMFYKLTKPTQGAENISSLLADPKIAAMADALQQDVKGSVAATGQAALPYAAIKELRTSIGNKIADAGLAPDVSTRQLKQLYGALSEDMRNGLQTVSPDAAAANNVAERFVRNGHDQIDKIESIVGRAGGPEKVFSAALSGTREGATTLNNVMSALQPDEQRIVASAVARRLGTATDSAQNAAGDVFSPQTFLTNWNKLDPRARQTLFQADPETLANLNQIAKVTGNLREGSKYLNNPSGTAPALMHASALLASLQALGTGNVPELAAIGAGVGGANIGARLMTNPDFVKWLARNSTAPMGVLPAQIGYLSQLGQKNNDQDLINAAQLIQQGTAQQPGLPQ